MVLVFDVEGDMALFRKPYTTTSMVSYPFPPPTALAGLIAAIVGINHNASEVAKNAQFWDFMQDMQVAVSLRSPIRWMNTAVNLMKYKTTNAANMSEHIQVKHQLVKNPCYRVYVRGGNLYTQLKKYLERNEFVYTPYLGSAYALADIYYQGEYQEKTVDNNAGFHTLLPAYEGVEVDVVRSGSIFSETIPARMSSQRRLMETVMVYYTRSDKENEAPLIFLRQQGQLETSEINGERVAWFNAW